MAVININIIPSKQAEAAQTTQFTATTKTIIDKFTATNTTTGDVTFSINLVNLSGTAGASDLILSRKILAGETYSCTEVVNQTLETGQLISTLASVASSITIRASGREIS